MATRKKANRAASMGSNGSAPRTRHAADQDRPRAVRTPSPSAGVIDPGNGLALPALEPGLFINRELSWLAFNRRVLEEAADPTTPLLERVKFAAIFAANLDEFFMIRVAGVKRKVAAGIADPGPDGRTPGAQLAVIRLVTQELLDEHVVFLC